MRRSTLVALILFILVGGLYWYTRQEGNLVSTALSGTPTPAPTPPGYLVEPYLKTISSIAIRQPDGKELALTLTGGIWTARDANSDLGAVDQAAADSALMNIQDLRILSEIEAASRPEDFGLDSASATQIDISFSDGATLSLRVGKETPTGSGYYALDESQPEKILLLAKLSLSSLLGLVSNPPIATADIPESTPTP
jgi:hypothetical protein